MKGRVLLAVSVLALFLCIPRAAKADTIGPDCGSCNGATYTLSYTGDPNSGTLTVTLTIDTSLAGFGLPGSLIDNVAFKITSDSGLSATLISAPGGLGNWTTATDSGINASGCSGSGSGFVCSDALSSISTGGVYSWTWTVSASSFFLDPLEASVKTRYVNGDGRKVGSLVSEPITLQNEVPEPATLTLLGTGLIGLGGVIRRRLRG